MNKTYLFGICLCLFQALVLGQETTMQLLFGVAYYDEYMPYERLEKDVVMMREAGINVVRIAESTWSTVEPQDNVFDFSHIDRVLNAMHKGNIKVIIGTPTYAVPTWLVKKYPAILFTTPQGQRQYGARQNMDIVNENFRFHAERVIRKIMEHVKGHPAIIGYQVDNETKHYNTAGGNVQKLFVQYMKDKFKTLEAVNKAFGLDYWSNRINNWDDFPSIGSRFQQLQIDYCTGALRRFGHIAEKLNAFVKNGGHVVYTFKSGFSDENVKVRSSVQPGIINEACGIFYSQFTIPKNVSLKGDPYKVGVEQNKVHTWMELITPTTAKVLAYYGHPEWGNYAAVTQNQYGKGVATYIGCMMGAALTERIMKEAVLKANVWSADQQLTFPIITKSGKNQQDKTVHYYFNYSANSQKIQYPHRSGNELLSNKSVAQNTSMELEAWGTKIIEEN